MPSDSNKGYLSLKGMQRYNYLIFAKCFISINACYETQSWLTFCCCFFKKSDDKLFEMNCHFFFVFIILSYNVAVNYFKFTFWA